MINRIIWFNIFNLADKATTYVGMKIAEAKFGVSAEANIASDFIMSKLGIGVGVIVLSIIGFTFGYLVYTMPLNSWIKRKSFYLLNLMFIFVIVNNIITINILTKW